MTLFRATTVTAILVYLLFGALYLEAVPPWEVPDEPWHAVYAEAVAAGSLPEQASTYEWHQPPLYYLWPALALRATGRSELPRSASNAYYPFDSAAYHHPSDEPAVGPLRLVRRFSGLLGALTVALTASAARAAPKPLGPRSAALAAFVVALLPQHLHIGHGVNNDVAAGAVGALLLYGAIKWAHAPRSRIAHVTTALGIGLAFLTKLTVIALLPAVVLGLLVGSYREARRPAELPRAVAFVLTTLAAPALMASAVLYAASPALLQVQLANAVERGVGAVPTTPGLGYLQFQALRTLGSLVGRFGWLTIDLPEWVYRVAAVMTVVSLVGVVLVIREHGRKRGPAAVGILWVAVAGALAAVLRNLAVDPQPQGRLMFPALCAIAILFALGWQSAASAIGRSLRALPSARLERSWIAAWSAAPIAVLALASLVAGGSVLPSAFARSSEPLPPGLIAVRVMPARWQPVADLRTDGSHAAQTINLDLERVRRVALPLIVLRAEGSLRLRLFDGAGSQLAAESTRLVDLADEGWPWLELTLPPPETSEEPDDPSAVPRGRAATLELELDGEGWVQLWGGVEDHYPAGALTTSTSGNRSRTGSPDRPRADLALVVVELPRGGLGGVESSEAGVSPASP